MADWTLGTTKRKPAFSNLGGTVGTSGTSYSIPLTGTYQSAGRTPTYQQPAPAPKPAPTSGTGYSSGAITALGGLSSGTGSRPPSTASTQAPASSYTAPRSPYSQPAQTSPSSSGAASARNASGQTMRDPGEYEKWYQRNASRYNQPTALSSYWQSVQGKVGGQRYQPNNAQSAFNSNAGALRNDSYGMTNARNVSTQLRDPSRGEGIMGQAAGMLGGPNQTQQYYGENQGFFGAPGDIEQYYDTNGGRFQQAGFGEQAAQGILGSEDLTGLYDNRLVGDELDYFREPLRSKSYSEDLYESGNQGLNTFYDRERDKRQAALEDRMAAMGVFGSGETVEAMYQLEGELGAAQARDMADLAGQADDQRLGRAGALMDFSSAAADEELGRGGLMLDATGRALELDRDAIDRLTAGGNLARDSSRYGLDRTVAGGDLARSADDSRRMQADSLGGIGRDMASESRQRLDASGRMGLDADAEQRLRLAEYYDQATGVDDLGLRAQADELSWIQTGGDMAGAVDRGNLDWLEGGGRAARGAQDAFQGRVGQLYGDTADLGGRMAGTYGEMTAIDASEQAGIRMGVINLLQAQYGMDAAAAERQASEWMQAGMMPLQVYAMMKGGGAGG